MESLCPACRFFITNSFAQYQENPSRNQLAEVIFYPYGNAKESWDGNKWVFTCQHGENECFGNIIEKCARIKLIKKDDFHKFLICLETDIQKTSDDFSQSTKNCIAEQVIANSIMICAKGDEGNKLEHDVAVATPPDHNHVP
jgi:interferon gamma-inducible protein 30